MKFSLEWLKKLVNTNSSIAELSDQITNAGLEVESVENEVFDISVPPNRADCLGMIGIAREVAAISGLKFIEPQIKPVTEKHQDKIGLQVQDSAACPKYLGRIIKGINNTKETPQWIKDCLVNADIKLISPVVDITNYVLIEWGQPLHAFDLRRLEGGVVVRKAKAGEQLTLLDDSTVKLTPETLVIADANKPLAIAGVKGGKDSGIAADTKEILIECAYFEPVGIRLTSRHFGLKTDGSYRFERCIDPTMQERVMDHVTQMMLDIVGGEAGPIIAFSDPAQLPKTAVIALRVSRIKKILGISIDADNVIKILQHLGFQIESHNGDDEIMITVPTFRPDITREVDVVEEVARIYGFQNIPTQNTVGTLAFKPLPEAKVNETQVMNCLVNRGYHEAITYSFIDLQYAKLFTDEINEDLCLTNPISSEMGFMRPSLLPGLVKALQYNQNRQQTRIRLFEIGLRFTGSNDKLQQRKTIAGICYGSSLPEAWGNQKRPVDIFDVKSDIIALLSLAHNAEQVKFKASKDKAMHPGQCLDVLLNEQVIGKIGAMHPSLQQELALPESAIMFELDYNALVNGKIASFKMFSKYPAVRRDLALLVHRNLAAGQLEQAIRRTVGILLTDLVIFDVYQGKGIAEDQKSMALGITLQNPERTLTDTEVNDVFTQLISMLQSEFNAILR